MFDRPEPEHLSELSRPSEREQFPVQSVLSEKEQSSNAKTSNSEEVPTNGAHMSTSIHEHPNSYTPGQSIPVKQVENHETNSSHNTDSTSQSLSSSYQPSGLSRESSRDSSNNSPNGEDEELTSNSASNNDSPNENGTSSASSGGASSSTMVESSDAKNDSGLPRSHKRKFEDTFHPVQVNQTPFIQKLYSMLEDPGLDEVINWSPTEDSFFINPGEKFSQILCLYFKHTNIASFIRQLSMYGFHKVNQHSRESSRFRAGNNLSEVAQFIAKYNWEFKHIDGSFRRGDFASLRAIKRRSSKRTSKDHKFERHIVMPPAAGNPWPPRVTSAPELSSGLSSNAHIPHNVPGSAPNGASSSATNGALNGVPNGVPNGIPNGGAHHGPPRMHSNSAPSVRGSVHPASQPNSGVGSPVYSPQVGNPVSHMYNMVDPSTGHQPQQSHPNQQPHQHHQHAQAHVPPPIVPESQNPMQSSQQVNAWLAQRSHNYFAYPERAQHHQHLFPPQPQVSSVQVAPPAQPLTPLAATSIPNGAVPNSAVPNSAVPGGAVHSESVHSGAVPGGNVPHANAPHGAAPNSAPGDLTSLGLGGSNRGSNRGSFSSASQQLPYPIRNVASEELLNRILTKQRQLEIGISGLQQFLNQLVQASGELSQLVQLLTSSNSSSYPSAVLFSTSQPEHSDLMIQQLQKHSQDHPRAAEHAQQQQGSWSQQQAPPQGVPQDGIQNGTQSAPQVPNQNAPAAGSPQFSQPPTPVRPEFQEQPRNSQVRLSQEISRRPSQVSSQSIRTAEPDGRPLLAQLNGELKKQNSELQSIFSGSSQNKQSGHKRASLEHIMLPPLVGTTGIKAERPSILDGSNGSNGVNGTSNGSSSNGASNDGGSNGANNVTDRIVSNNTSSSVTNGAGHFPQSGSSLSTGAPMSSYTLHPGQQIQRPSKRESDQSGGSSSSSSRNDSDSNGDSNGGSNDSNGDSNNGSAECGENSETSNNSSPDAPASDSSNGSHAKATATGEESSSSKLQMEEATQSTSSATVVNDDATK